MRNKSKSIAGMTPSKYYREFKKHLGVSVNVSLKKLPNCRKNCKYRKYGCFNPKTDEACSLPTLYAIRDIQRGIIK